MSSTSPRSTSATGKTPVTWRSGTGSIHTVCQMPLTGVYQIPSGLSFCLPRGCGPSSDGSQTRTTSSLAPGFKCAVTSNEKGSEPPL